jgi:hypothetical protein
MTSARGRTVADWEKTRRRGRGARLRRPLPGPAEPAHRRAVRAQRVPVLAADADPWRVALPGRVVDVRHGFRFATVDFAGSTRTSADYTVCAVWCMSLDGELILLDLWRGQEKPELHWDFIRPVVEKVGRETVSSRPSQWGTDLVYSAGREGWALDKVHPDADKYTRALPAARGSGRAACSSRRTRTGCRTGRGARGVPERAARRPGRRRRLRAPGRVRELARRPRADGAVDRAWTRSRRRRPVRGG